MTTLPALDPEVLVHIPVSGWRHLRLIEPITHGAMPTEHSMYLQRGTRNLEAKCVGCDEAIIAFYDLTTVIAAAEARGAAKALADAAGEQRRLSTGPRALGSRAVQFKRIIFATWLDDRAANYRKADR